MILQNVTVSVSNKYRRVDFELAGLWSPIGKTAMFYFLALNSGLVISGNVISIII